MSMSVTQDDRLAMIAACSTLGASQEERGRKGPLGPDGWSRVAQWLGARSLRPANLLDPALDFDDLDPRLAERVAGLSSRAALVAMEVERYQLRGIWSLVRIEEGYPARWRERLKHLAPPVIFGAGDRELLDRSPALAIVGSREISETLQETAQMLGRRTAAAGYLIVSGGARGSDRWGMFGALEEGLPAIGILHGDLEKESRRAQSRQFIEAGQLCLIAHVHPATGFDTGNAMTRNRFIHAFADATVVISTSSGSGGTWQGATDNLRSGWSPLLVWTGEDHPEGNRILVNEGGFPFGRVPESREEVDELIAQAREHRGVGGTAAANPVQPPLM